MWLIFSLLGVFCSILIPVFAILSGRHWPITDDQLETGQSTDAPEFIYVDPVQQRKWKSPRVKPVFTQQEYIF